ncbi:MAG: hypothetical protein PHQ79_04530 [Bacilli bacterium]|jgi:hypothetical protein|nr:hypothetical protein [Bacilli bacterium]MDD3121703.1 hypothetical protein [Bacilli bacterium]MDD4063656.1 hypothetical protein [Bacilli bacterium]
MKLFKNKKGMSLFYVIIMMAVVTALSSAMIAAAVYNNTLARLTESKFERRIELDQIGEDFLGGIITSENFEEYDTIYEIIWHFETIETVEEIGIIVKKEDKNLLIVKMISGTTNITSWIYGEE